MKTPEETLEQWVNDRIRFCAKKNNGKDFWTRTELSLVASRLASIDTLSERHTRGPLGVSAEAVRSLKHGRSGGPKITAQYLASFDSIEELIEHFLAHGWLP